jgi:hypothetical protein
MRLSTLDLLRINHLKAHPQNIPRIPRIDHTVITQMRARLVTIAIPLHSIPQSLHPLLDRHFISLFASGFRTVFFDCLHDSRQLVGSHDAAAGAGPGEHEARLEFTAAHCVVAGAVGGAEDDRDGWDFGAADRGDHLGAFLDDGGVLGFGADHEACHVVQEDYGDVPEASQ